MDDEQQVMLLLIRSDGVFNITGLVQSIEWSGRKGSAPRSLTVKLLDSSEYDRSGIDVSKGHNLVFYWNGVELFRGMIVKQTDNDSRIMQVTAYDLCRYLSNNRDSFSYEKKTLTYIFKDVLSRFNIPVGSVANCSYVVETISKKATTAWDILTDAMQEAYKYTGERYYIYCEGEKISLIKRKDSMILWTASEGTNLISYSRSRDFSNIITRVKLLGDEDKLITQETDSNLENLFGIYQTVQKPAKDLGTAKYKQIAQNILKEDGKPDEYVEISAVGITDCITGTALMVSIPEIGVNWSYYVDEDKHTFEANKKSFNDGFNHIMRLKLRLTNEIQG